MRQTVEGVETMLQDGNSTIEAAFDAVVLADGLHSEDRAMLLAPDQVTTYDTGGVGWVTWIDTDTAHIDRGDEIWGAGFFVGIYPVKGHAGVFVGGDRADMREGPAAFVAHIRSQLTTIDPWFERALAKVEAGQNLYFWKLTDCRADSWAVGRAALLGDAAAGFLPTAGIGAGMAMKSAAVLAPHLLGADPRNVGEALLAYERSQRPRVEAAQDNSRQLAKLMFRRSKALALIRDMAVRLVPLATVLGPIRKLLDDGPSPA
jgi:2-polyprenyl-6-methoxyphenol hydroxylase-like FAD-dependent oxidoreductase